MAIPNFQMIMLPLMLALEDGRSRSMRELTQLMADAFGLTEEERTAKLPSGQQTIISNRVGWAKSDLKFAGLLENPVRGQVHISELGRSVLAAKPAVIDMKFLEKFPAHIAYRARSQASQETSAKPTEAESLSTPLESIESSFQTLRQSTAEDLVTRLKTASPAFFEDVVVKLLMAMGYGGVAGQGTVTGKTGDGGIDGVIQQDKLGLDIVCIQAKRWEAPVGRPTVQGFVGSMDYVRSKKGVMMTTSTFTKDARDFVHRIEAKRVVLIDGDQLADLMIEHDLGVTTTKVYAIKEVSNDFFDESEA